MLFNTLFCKKLICFFKKINEMNRFKNYTLLEWMLNLRNFYFLLGQYPLRTTNKIYYPNEIEHDKFSCAKR